VKFDQPHLSFSKSRNHHVQATHNIQDDVMTQNDDLADRFDADVLLATSELKVLRSHLIAALRGEVQS
jgi:DNA recombination-dependent growth factor C